MEDNIPSLKERIKEKEQIISNLKKTIQMLEQTIKENPLQKEVTQLQENVYRMAREHSQQCAVASVLEDQIEAVRSTLALFK